MDQTLAQILNKLFELQIQVQNLVAENTRLKQVIDSKLPVNDGTEIAPNNQEL